MTSSQSTLPPRSLRSTPARDSAPFSQPTPTTTSKSTTPRIGNRGEGEGASELKKRLLRSTVSENGLLNGSQSGQTKGSLSSSSSKDKGKGKAIEPVNEKETITPSQRKEPNSTASTSTSTSTTTTNRTRAVVKKPRINSTTSNQPPRYTMKKSASTKVQYESSSSNKAKKSVAPPPKTNGSAKKREKLVQSNSGEDSSDSVLSKESDDSESESEDDENGENGNEDQVEGEEGEETEEDSQESRGGSEVTEDTMFVTEDKIAALEDAEQSRAYSKLSWATSTEAVNTAAIRIGDIVEIAADKPINSKRNDTHKLSEGWLGVVEEIRQLNDDSTKEPDVYVKVSWLYTKKDTLEYIDPFNAWTKQVEVMGPNERIKGEITNWHPSNNIIRLTQPDIVYVFNDCYPAPNASGFISPHPLAHYSAVAVKLITPSRYASTAVEQSISRATGLPTVASRRPGNRTDVPNYFFAIEAAPSHDPSNSIYPRLRKPLDVTGGYEPTSKEIYADHKTGKKDGGQTIPYVRVGFNFSMQPVLKKDRNRMDEDDEEEEEEEEEDEINEKERRIWKREKEKLGIKVTRNDEPEKIWPLVFTTHSDPPAPYDPHFIQVYSQSARKWYNVEDLLQRGSYRPKEPNVVVEQQVPQTPPYDYEDSVEPSLRSTVDSIIPGLVNISESTIVRGSAYGLTGNSFLVVYSKYLLNRLQPLRYPLPPSDEYPRPREIDSNSKTLPEKAFDLVESYESWKSNVEEISSGRNRGVGLKKVWKVTMEDVWRKVRKGMEGVEEEEDVELEWVCPETDTKI